MRRPGRTGLCPGLFRKAWKIARKEIMKYPSVNEFPGEEDEKEIA